MLAPGTIAPGAGTMADVDPVQQCVA